MMDVGALLLEVQALRDECAELRSCLRIEQGEAEVLKSINTRLLERIGELQRDMLAAASELALLRKLLEVT